MHTYWKNCPVGWQGSFKGKEKRASIVLEAISDHHLWFWHAAYGYAGTMNDKSILAMSPWLESVIDGSFEALEKEAVAPFKVGEKEFEKMYVLVDGIYPSYSRFVRGFKVPTKRWEQKFTAWQEACRKDIERAFGVLQGKWQCLSRPLHYLDLNHLSSRVACCLILHNMCVSDRIMGDVHARYNPAFALNEYEETPIRYPSDLLRLQGHTADEDRSRVGAANIGRVASSVVTRKDRWVDLRDSEQQGQLTKAFKIVFSD
jgi:hypothetical protein